jgi:hypothetical protein
MPPVRTRALLVLVILSTVAATGCKRRTPPPPPQRTVPVEPGEALPAVAPAAHWKERKLVVDGQPTWTFELSYGVKGDVSFSVAGQARWPHGTKVILGEQEGRLESFKATTISEAYGIFGALPLSHADADAGAAGLARPSRVTFEPTARLVIRLSNGVELALPLPEGEVTPGLPETIMKEAAKAALRFDGEKDAAGPHTTFYVHATQSGEAVGPGKTLADADWVASSTSEYAKIDDKLCSFNTGSKYPLEVETQAVTIFDRRTHAVIETKVFRPVKVGCPTFAFGGRAIIGAGRPAIVAWLRSVAKVHGG